MNARFLLTAVLLKLYKIILLLLILRRHSHNDLHRHRTTRKTATHLLYLIKDIKQFLLLLHVISRRVTVIVYTVMCMSLVMCINDIVWWRAVAT